MPADVTTGGEVARAGAAALVFAIGGALWIAFLTKSAPSLYGRWLARRWSSGVVVLMGVGGLVAVVVGLVCAALGINFGTDP